MVPGTVVEPPPPGLERNSNMHTRLHPESACRTKADGASAGAMTPSAETLTFRDEMRSRSCRCGGRGGGPVAERDADPAERCLESRVAAERGETRIDGKEHARTDVVIDHALHVIERLVEAADFDEDDGVREFDDWARRCGGGSFHQFQALGPVALCAVAVVGVEERAAVERDTPAWLPRDEVGRFLVFSKVFIQEIKTLPASSNPGTISRVFSASRAASAGRPAK